MILGSEMHFSQSPGGGEKTTQTSSHLSFQQNVKKLRGCTYGQL